MSSLSVDQQSAKDRTIPRVRIPRLRWNVAREFFIVGAFVYVYFAVRGLIHSRESVAWDNAEKLIDFEKAVGLFHEKAVQSWILPHDWLVDTVNSIYIYGHWPIIVGTLLWLLICHRSHLAMFRSAFLISGFAGFFFFRFFPVAPPRFMTEYGFVDTVTLHSNAYRVLQPPNLTNQFAAMPSLHVGWNLLMGVAIVWLASKWYAKLFGVLMPLLMYFSTILTANHYFIDGIAGSALALTGLAIAWKISGPKRKIEPVPAPAPVTSAAIPAGQ